MNCVCSFAARYSYVIIFFLLTSCKHEPSTPPELPHGGNYKTIRHIGTAELSEARMGISAVAIGNKILFAGGYYAQFIPVPGGDVVNFHTKRVDIYDAQSNTWSIDSLSEARSKMAAVSTTNKVFFAGGWRSFRVYPSGLEPFNTARVDIYNPVTNTWRIDSLSEPRNSVAGAVFANQAFFAGGFGETNIATTSVDVYAEPGTWSHKQMSTAAAGKSAVSGNELFIAPPYGDTVKVYNLSNNNVRTIQLSSKRSQMTVAAAGGLVLFAGGTTENNVKSNVVDIYDTKTNTWSRDSISQARSGIGSISAGNKILFAGGRGIDSYSSKVIDIYDVKTRKWSRDSLTNPCSEPSGAVAGNKILIENSTSFTKNVDIYELIK